MERETEASMYDRYDKETIDGTCTPYTVLVCVPFGLGPVHSQRKHPHLVVAVVVILFLLLLVLSLLLLLSLLVFVAVITMMMTIIMMMMR